MKRARSGLFLTRLVKPFELDERVREVSIRPPANLGFASGPNSLRLVWSPASAGREVTYEVRFKLFAAQQWSAWETTGATSHEIVGLDSATCYDVQVRSRTGELSGGAAPVLCRTMSRASEPYDLVKTGRPTPAFSDILSCAPNGRGEIEVRVLSDPGVYTYEIVVSGSNGVPVTVQRTSTSTVLTGLQCNDTYTIRARTVLEVNGITYHEDILGQETCTTGIFMISAVTCVPRSKDSLLVTWPPLPGGSSPVSYSLRHKSRADEQWGPWGPAGVQTLTVLSGLQPDTLYDIEVRAREGDRQSEPVSASCTTLSA